MSFAPQFRMSAGGESGQKGPAVSAQEAQMQAIMQQARVPLLLLSKYLVAIHFPCFHTHTCLHFKCSLVTMLILCFSLPCVAPQVQWV